MDGRAANEQGISISAARASELFLLGLILLLVLPWAPLYVQWPRSPDHEHFASQAFGWSQGLEPYRDTINVNFPGAVIVFWLLGSVCGWDSEWSIYALDLLSLFMLSFFLLAWSRRLTGNYVAGLGTLATFLSYYTTLTYTLTAQRESHAALLVLVAVLAPTGWQGRGGTMGSGVAFAAAFLLRPHVVLFLPAIAIALATPIPQPLRTSVRTMLQRLITWSVAAVAASLIWWAPLLVTGLWRDFGDAMQLSFFGDFRDLEGRGRPSPATILREFFWVKHPIGLSVVIAVASIVTGWLRWRSVWAVVAAGQIAGLAYVLLHPVRHAYLDQPLMAFWAVGLGLFLAQIGHAVADRVWAIILTLVVTLVFQFPHDQYRGSLRLAFRTLQGDSAVRFDIWGRLGAGPCPGVTWEEYVDLRRWIHGQTAPETRVANFILGITVGSNENRLSALPIEGPWLWYHRGSEPRIREALMRHRDTIVLWLPEEFPNQVGDHPDLLRIIETDFVPAARFGRTEVRRREPQDAVESRGVE